MRATTKLINDPVYGFISLPDPLILNILDHPVVQRMRRIRQMGLAHLVYPGAHHTRFLHALGAMHLAARALQNLREKEIPFTPEERLALLLAVLLHDVGHGPFSHALEGSLIGPDSHETLSGKIIEQFIPLPEPIRSMCLAMLRGTYPKPWLNDMVASQLDMDRLDYLARDSFFTGVSEGVIGAERILSLLTVAEERLAIEEKGIYSIEKFLLARHLMYWQVYLHKTVLSAEFQLLLVLRRLKDLWAQGQRPPVPESLKALLEAESELARLEAFTRLDDADISYGLKLWAQPCDDLWLGDLSRRLLERRLFKTLLWETSPDNSLLERLKVRIDERLGAGAHLYYLKHGPLTNRFYDSHGQPVFIRTRAGRRMEATEYSPTIRALAHHVAVEKYFVTAPDFAWKDSII
ncbi:MAG: HD domain-containing protein [Flavobacteriales bacterium]|nr:HD domain-containing protein [Flavobacteriales bacterium]MDW8432596.1 HD domain-containing protein [Flavobacteriales bacterium]